MNRYRISEVETWLHERYGSAARGPFRPNRKRAHEGFDELRASSPLMRLRSRLLADNCHIGANG
jgi:hypothetical protein